MTVQNYIVNYSATFEYLHKRFGKKAVVQYWEYLGSIKHDLHDAVKEDGLEGYLRYFYGDSGTCTREHVEGGAWIEDGVFTEKITNCPSVSAMEARGKRPYRYYCEHCYWLYRQSLEENGFIYEADYELQPKDEGYCKSCTFHARAKEDCK